MLRRALIVAGLALAAAPAAQAGQITRVDDHYVYTSTAAVQNTVQLNYCNTCSPSENDVYLIKDSGEAASAGTGSGCGPSIYGADLVSCPAAGIGAWTINLGPGNDTNEFGVGSDPWPVSLELRGEAGLDQLLGGPLADSLNGGSENDGLVGGEGDDVLDGGFGSDTINGGAGTGDLVSYASRTDGVTVNLGNAGNDDGSANDGPVGTRDNVSTTDVEGIIGSEGVDVLSGNNLGIPLTIEGRGAGDSITGGAGANTLRGEGGPDNLLGNADPDVLEGGDGNDTLNGQAQSDTVRGGAGFDTIEARDGVQDDVDCGPDDDSALTDAIATRVNCDPAPPAGGDPPGGGSPPAAERLLATLSFRKLAGRRGTILRRLFVRGMPAGSTLRVRCRTRSGRRCAGTRDLAKTDAGGSLRLRSFEGRRLPVGAKLTVRVTKDGMIGAVKTLTIRKGKAPSQRTLCIPPGATRPSAC
jgi:hypothetical protein